MQDDIKNCKIGDKVYSKNHWHGIEIYTITRETKTLFILDDKIKVNKDSGREPGSCGSWGHGYTYYHKVNDDILFEYEVQKLRHLMESINPIKININKNNFNDIKNCVEKILTYKMEVKPMK